MPVEFKLPDIGEGVAEGEIVAWRVHEGDLVIEDQPLVEVMTDKVTVEIPSPVAGRVLEIRAREGDVIPVGATMVVLGDAAPCPEAVPVPKPAANGGHAAEDADTRVRAVPLVRRLARELNVDIASVAGTGPAGRITEADVRAAADAGQVSRVTGRESRVAKPPERETPPPARVTEPPSAGQPPSTLDPRSSTLDGREERVPFRGIRRRIAERLVQSLQTTAPFTFVDEVDMTELVAVREGALAWAEQRGLKLTYLPFIIKALIAALREHPALNATVDEERGEIILKRYYNIGIATHTEEGLIVPVVRDADRKGLWQLCEEIEALAVKARTGSLSLEEIQDGTFTVTSLGVLGGVMATPIINPPEVAILGVHLIRPQPVVRQGQIVIRQMAHLSLTFDHRVIDGYVGAEFVRTMINYLEHPALLMLVESEP
jgi:pyruvate dehydrogenase E2 component (dihydrolipoamide acetyltransferase)